MGQKEGAKLDIISAFEAYGESVTGKIVEEERQVILLS